MDITAAFGQRVTQLSQRDPDKARRFLLLGWRANGLKNRLQRGKRSKSDRMLFQAVNAAMVNCLARPEQNVMVSLFTPCEPLLTQGLLPYSCEAFSSYLSGSMAEESFLRHAEDAGIPTSLCSYHKIFIGAAQTALMPRPRFILNTSLACDANTLTFRYLAEHYGVPHFSIDIPYEQTPQAVDYVTGQLREMSGFLQAQTGIAVDEARLIQTVGRSQRTLQAYNDFLTQRAGKELLSDLTSELYRTAAFHLLLGSPESEAVARQMVVEAQAAGPARGRQLLWLHTTPYWVPPLRALFDHNPKVQIVASDMSYEGYVPDADPEKPYETMAKRLVYSPFNGPAQRRIQTALEVAKRVQADGVVWFCHWGCKHTLGGAQLGKRAFEAQGLPTLLLDGDSCDRGFGGEGQAATRMEAFLELLTAQEKGGPA